MHGPFSSIQEAPDLGKRSRLQFFQGADFHADGSGLCSRFHHFACGGVADQGAGLAGRNLAQRHFHETGQDKHAGAFGVNRAEDRVLERCENAGRLLAAQLVLLGEEADETGFRQRLLDGLNRDRFALAGFFLAAMFYAPCF